MSSNVINFPEREPSALSRFDDSPEPAYFLDAIEEVFRAQQSLKPLEARLDKFKALTTEKEVREKVFSQACVLLSKLRFSSIDSSKKSSNSPAIAPTQKDKEAAASLMEIIDKEDERKEHGKETPYRSYPPAYSYTDVIPLIFKDDDPVRVVCEYMQALCPTDFYRHPNDCWFGDKERIAVSSDGQKFFLKEILQPLAPYSMEGATSADELAGAIVMSYLEFYFYGVLNEIGDKDEVFDLKLSKKELKDVSREQQEKVANSLFDSLKTYEGFLTVFFGAFFDIPQGLFVAVIRHWRDNGPALKQSSASHHLMEALANYPVGRPPDSWTDVGAGAHDEEWAQRMQTVFSNPGSVPFVPCGMSENRWFWDLFDEFVPYEYNQKSTHDTYWSTLRAWSSKIAMLRNRQLHGRYPWKPESLGCNWYHSYDETRPEWDTHLHIEALIWDDEDSGKWNYGTDDFGDDDENGHRSFKLHKNFWIAAEREGFSEFGNAVLAFYLMRKAICDSADHSYLHVDWKEFSALIHQALDRPGHRWVRIALEFMKLKCTEKSWDLDGLRLRNIVPSSARVMNFPSISEVQERIEAPRRKCEEKIETEIGTDLWNRFSMRSKNLMIDAEIEFERHALDLGRGLSEFAGAVLNYAKPFECELGGRLKQVYELPEMRKFLEERPTYRKSQNLVLGDYLFMLKLASDAPGKAGRMPAELIAIVESKGVTSHRNPDLLKRLHMLRKRRNSAAHVAEKTLPGGLADMRHFVFAEGLLRDFLVTLSPVD